MWLRDTWNVLTRHPLNRDRKLAAIARWARWQAASLIAPGPIAVPFVNDVRLLARFGMTSATGNIYAGLYEFEDMALVGHLLRPGELFVDVGANIGSYALLAAAVGARVLALEPVPETFADLQANVRLNALEGRVDARNLGAGDQPKHLRFTRVHGAMNHVAADHEQGIEVQVDTLDRLLAGARPRFIKIDVEGYEAAVLEGGRATLDDPELLGLLVELGGHGARYGADERALHAQIQQRGFSPVIYQPLARRLSPLGEGLPRSYDSNTLYVRDLRQVEERVASAPPLRLPGTSV